jgi:NADH dehydrogenase (ubiquinone) 1 alpha subcomplex subunit 13
MAPRGGYAPVDIRRNVPRSVTTRGAVALFAASGAIMAWGFYRVGTWNVHRRGLKAERKEVRLAILPLLQAEEDARFCREKEGYVEWEREVMKGVEGWNPDANVYKTRTFMQPFHSTSAFTR